MPKHLISVPWYGGKYTRLNWLLPRLPRAQHYCEPFGGAASVLLNRRPAPLETYNDLFGEVVNFFRVLRDDGYALQAALQLTPYAREEFLAARPDAQTAALPPLERARRFYVRARQCYGGMAQLPDATWGYSRTEATRGGGRVTASWLSAIEALPEIIERLTRVQIECAPAIEVIRRYDTPFTLFYCDPPYPMDVRQTDQPQYAHELTEADHRELAGVLNACQGSVAVSGYDGPLFRELYPPPHWRHQQDRAKGMAISSGTQLATEHLWTNYNPKGDPR